MAQKTKEQLKSTLVNGHLVTGGDFTDIIDSLKSMQSPVTDPTASGMSTAFIATIVQNENGEIVVTKKNVNFSGYQTTAGMATYQDGDLQQVGPVNVDGSGTDIATAITHNMKHYPTVRLIDTSGVELRPRAGIGCPYIVQHVDINSLKITLVAAVNVGGAQYKYILD